MRRRGRRGAVKGGVTVLRGADWMTRSFGGDSFFEVDSDNGLAIGLEKEQL